MEMLMYMGTFPFEEEVYLNYEYCTDSIIRFRYKKLVSEVKEVSEPSKPSKDVPKGPPNKERSIGEVMELVKKFKSLCA